MYRSAIALIFVLVWSVPGMGGVVKVYLESAPGFGVGKFGRVFSDGLHDPPSEYAPLLAAGMDEYPNATMPTELVSVSSDGAIATGVGSTRISGRVTHGVGQVGIYTTAYSKVHNPATSDYNLVAGRLRIELDATDYFWAITNPIADADRTFKGFLTSDANGTLPAPVQLVGGGVYYFHFEYFSKSPDTDFAASSRTFELELTDVSVVPEPSSMLVFGGVCIVGMAMRRRQNRMQKV